ncbi:hypothetical protein TYRP_006739 [Tyrophagus putrescentiae]|nr:hypothetical protein TYRP_006739 [Tyrophagus putrescentiae]
MCFFPWSPPLATYAPASIKTFSALSSEQLSTRNGSRLSTSECTLNLAAVRASSRAPDTLRLGRSQRRWYAKKTICWRRERERDGSMAYSAGDEAAVVCLKKGVISFSICSSILPYLSVAIGGDEDCVDHFSALLHRPHSLCLGGLEVGQCVVGGANGSSHGAPPRSPRSPPRSVKYIIIIQSACREGEKKMKGILDDR